MWEFGFCIRLLSILTFYCSMMYNRRGKKLFYFRVHSHIKEAPSLPLVMLFLLLPLLFYLLLYSFCLFFTVPEGILGLKKVHTRFTHMRVELQTSAYSLSLSLQLSTHYSSWPTFECCSCCFFAKEFPQKNMKFCRQLQQEQQQNESKEKQKLQFMKNAQS